MLQNHEFDGSDEFDELIAVNDPEECPMCEHKIGPIFLYGIVYEGLPDEPKYTAVYKCPHCFDPFIASFDGRSPHPEFVAPNRPVVREFNPKIVELSPRFCEIYNQALACENNKQDELSGMGYRKALEFLIKDYLIRKSPDEADAIRNASLGSCINQRLDYDKLKAVASRAAWIGNDYTHYTRKYEDLDLTDLKQFIDAALHWIIAEITTDEALSIERH